MRVALLGGAGFIGQSIAQSLAEQSEVSLVVADRRPEALTRLANVLGVEARALDATDIPAVARWLRGAEFVVNAGPYPTNLRVMEAALEAGVDYLDLGGLYHTTRRQLELDARFRAAGRLAILGCGKAPGLTNLLTAAVVSRFDAVDALHLRSGRGATTQDGRFRLPYSAATLLDEFTLPPVVLREGRLVEVEPLSGAETIRHPEPWGPIDYVTTLHSELATLPAFVGRGVRSMEFKVGLAPSTASFLARLVELGFASSEPLPLGGFQVVPREVAVELLSRAPASTGPEQWVVEAEVVGRSNGSPVRTVARASGDETTNGTALAAVAAVRLRSRGRLRAVGVLAPEVALPAESFFEALEAYGIKVNIGRNGTTRGAG